MPRTLRVEEDLAAEGEVDERSTYPPSLAGVAAKSIPHRAAVLAMAMVSATRSCLCSSSLFLG
jgi:hypothetical protein